MKPKTFYILASISIAIAGLVIWSIIDNYYDHQRKAMAQQQADVIMFKNEGCKCCDKWATYLQGAGYSVTTRMVADMNTVKQDKNVPAEMSSCHTAVIDGYVVEGHVPAEDIRRLLAEKPEAVGIAAPGMPSSAPGMNTKLNEPFEVRLFTADGSSTVFAEH